MPHEYRTLALSDPSIVMFVSNVPGPSDPRESPDPRPQVLLVDDDEEILKFFGAALMDHFGVYKALDGPAALEILAQHPLDLVISDIAMPGMSGMELLSAIRERDLDLPVVLVTGDPKLDSAMQAVEHGALRYLTKPVAIEDLQNTAARGARMRRMAAAKREAFKMVSGHSGVAADSAGAQARFNKALETLYLDFQPIVSWSKRRPVGFECLLRTHESSLKHPPDLLRSASGLDRMNEVGRCIRNAAAERLEELPFGARFFVNLHHTDLNDEDLFDPNSALAQNSSRFVLEITERESLQAIADARAKVAALRDLGFLIAMDDLGAGHNGLAAFAKLEPDIIKLDMLLVRGADREVKKRRLIRLMSEFCAEENIDFIAEGVETRAELDALLESGCDLFQGYFLGKPNPQIRVPILDDKD